MYAQGSAKRYWPMNWHDGIRASDIRHTRGVFHSDEAITALREPMKGNHVLSQVSTQEVMPPTSLNTISSKHHHPILLKIYHVKYQTLSRNRNKISKKYTIIKQKVSKYGLSIMALHFRTLILFYY